MPSKSKNKGSSFEREIAKFLSEIYSEPFVRVPNSGAYIGGSNNFRKSFLNENQAKSFKGDITAPDSWIYFNAEAKNYADFPFHQVLSSECKLLNSWLEQLMAVSEPNDLNILFLKFNRKGKFICVQSKLAWVTDNFLYYTSKNLGDWLIIEFNHFWEHNTQLVKAYSGSKDTTSTINNFTTDTTSIIENLKIKNNLSLQQPE